MSEPILVAQRGRVTTVTLNRPEKKNALTQAMYATLADAFETYAGDAQRALILTGQGEMFSAGNDVGDFARGDRGDLPPVMRFLGALQDCPKPVLVAVNGPAIGVGLTLLLHADLVFAGARATFNAPFAKLALVPEAGSSMLLPAAVGMAVANDLLLAGRTLSAPEALGFGLVSRVFPDSELQAGVDAVADQIAAMAPDGLRKSKALIRGPNREAVRAQMMAEAKVFSAQLETRAFAESVAAVMEKRAPRYDEDLS